MAAQTGKVEVMKAEVAAGKLGKDVLDRQEGLLSKMTVSNTTSYLHLCCTRLQFWAKGGLPCCRAASTVSRATLAPQLRVHSGR